MTARTFGRKGMADGAVAPAAQRVAFGARDPDHFEPVEIDEAALRRAAFAAEERARSEDRARAEQAAAEIPLPAPVVPTDRSLKAAYALWLGTGLAGGHRFYLRRPLTGAAQAVLFLGCWGAALAEYYAAFSGLAISCIWLLVDGLLLSRLHAGSGRA
jgi:TM2 domain-containing membrane protein YozV